jgi:glycosyltransferase involved in cell wall biosynthesis
MKDSFLSVWIDPTSSFGTFPLESMKMGIPVIGLVPNLKPSWLNEDNGLWLVNKNSIVDVIADYVQNWLEDNINPYLYNAMETTSKNFSDFSKFEGQVLEVFGGILETRQKSFEEQLNKFEITE